MTPIVGESGKVEYVVEHRLPVREASSFSAERDLAGKSPALNRMAEPVRRVGPSGSTALLLGESGTGKEPVAQAIPSKAVPSRDRSRRWNARG